MKFLFLLVSLFIGSSFLQAQSRTTPSLPRRPFPMPDLKIPVKDEAYTLSIEDSADLNIWYPDSIPFRFPRFDLKVFRLLATIPQKGKPGTEDGFFTPIWRRLLKEPDNSWEILGRGYIHGYCSPSLRLIKQNGIWLNHIMIDNDSLYEDFFKGCEDDLGIKIDFSQKILLLKRSGGDCHAWFMHQAIWNPESKTLVWKEYNFWGGCRAAGNWWNYIVVPRPKGDFQIEVEEVLTD